MTNAFKTVEAINTSTTSIQSQVIEETGWEAKNVTVKIQDKPQGEERIVWFKNEGGRGILKGKIHAGDTGVSIERFSDQVTLMSNGAIIDMIEHLVIAKKEMEEEQYGSSEWVVLGRKISFLQNEAIIRMN